jgi:hypothetical protein
MYSIVPEDILATLDTGSNTYSNDIIARKLFEAYLEKKKKQFGPTSRITDYQINEVKVESETTDGFVFSVNFDVLPSNPNQYIFAGNGEVVGEWIKERKWFVNVRRKGNIYEMISTSTSP